MSKVEAFLWAFMTGIAYPFVGWMFFGLLGILGGFLLGAVATSIRWSQMR